MRTARTGCPVSDRNPPRASTLLPPRSTFACKTPHYQSTDRRYPRTNKMPPRPGINVEIQPQVTPPANDRVTADNARYSPAIHHDNRTPPQPRPAKYTV